MKCEICGEEFHAVRCDARFCSGRCRTAAYRGELPFAQRSKAVTPVAGVPEQMQQFAKDHNLTLEEPWFRVIELASAKREPVTDVTDDTPRRVLRLPDGTETTFAATSDNWYLCNRMLELEAENRALADDATAKVRGLTDDELAALGRLGDADDRIEELEDKVRDLKDEVRRHETGRGV